MSSLTPVSGHIRAAPNPIQIRGGTRRDALGTTRLEWSCEGVKAVEVHVDAPLGPLVSRSGASGSFDTGEWVRDGMKFYLQDVSDGRSLDPSYTLDVVTVAVCVIESADIPEPGSVEFGSLRRLVPISEEWGFDRGQPIDRYYIEKFLERHSDDICGRVLEFGDSSYTRRFGGERVTTRDVLNFPHRTAETTFCADLADAAEIHSGLFDCVICTQTLQCVLDIRPAIRTLHRLLKRRGRLLATFPGISQTYDPVWGEQWYWNFTSVSARRLFEEVFGADRTQVEASGNVLAAIAFLHGLAASELTPAELDKPGTGYEVTIAVRAQRSE